MGEACSRHSGVGPVLVPLPRASLVITFVLAVAASYYVSRADPRGKSLPELAAGPAAYLVRPKRVTLAGERVRLRPRG